MLGKRSAQQGLLEAGHVYLDHVGHHTFYGFLASMRGRLFEDEEFGQMYCRDNGRNTVPPSLLATTLWGFRPDFQYLVAQEALTR